MPARMETIQIVPEESGQPGLIMTFPFWWNWPTFVEKYRDRELDLENPIYLDLAWLLSANEAILWDERCKKEFPNSEIDAHPDRIDRMRQLSDALRKARWVIAESREWESGLS